MRHASPRPPGLGAASTTAVTLCVTTSVTVCATGPVTLPVTATAHRASHNRRLGTGFRVVSTQTSPCSPRLPCCGGGCGAGGCRESGGAALARCLGRSQGSGPATRPTTRRRCRWPMASSTIAEGSVCGPVSESVGDQQVRVCRAEMTAPERLRAPGGQRPAGAGNLRHTWWQKRNSGVSLGEPQ